jgi:hypothetical protein
MILPENISLDENSTYSGRIIKSRYLIGEYIDSGAFGKIYQVTDQIDA